MNPFNAITFAALCGPLAQPAVMAQDFLAQPVPVMASAAQKFPTQEEYARSVEEGSEALHKLISAVDDYYIQLVEMNAAEARQVVVENGLEASEACELFLRAFEAELKKTLAKDLPTFITSQLKVYWRRIAKARSSVVRLNQFSKSLFKDTVIFQSDTNLSALGELAAYTSASMKEIKFH